MILLLTRLCCVWNRSIALLLGATLINLIPQSAGVFAEPTLDFSRDVQPILSDHCYQCHGPDEQARSSELRLDVAESAFADLGGYAAFVPGKPVQSEAIRRVFSNNADEQMPPAEAKLALTEHQKTLLRRWVEQGAPWEQHWAFEPVTSPPSPPSDPWCQNFIDGFILKKLRENGLEPSTPTERETLIRRVTFDLTGLPPTPSEVDQFVKDERVNAYELLVARLLESDAHAERLAMEWLDVGRYADSHGLHADGERNSWPWRDWVIQAFRENMPYDQFVTWQLAGDLLPNCTTEQRLATAFLRNHPMTGEGGVIDEEFRWNYVFDRVETVSTALLGLTMKCARCHDHKFDPLTQRDYYRLAAFFNNVRELGMTGDDGDYGPVMYLRGEPLRNELAALDGKISALDEQLALLKENEASTSDASSRQSGSLPTPVLHLPMDDVLEIEVAEKPAAEKYDDETKDKAPTIEVKLEKQQRLDGREQVTHGILPGIVEGLRGRAIHLLGEYGKLEIKGLKQFEASDAFSAAIWAWPEPRLAGQPATSRMLLGNAGDKNEMWRGWEFFLDPQRRLALTLVHALPENQIRIRTVAYVPLESWTHLAFSYKGTGRGQDVALFINGQQQDVEVVDDGLSRTILPMLNKPGHPIDSERPLRVGRSRRGYTGDYGIFAGRLDDLLLWDQAISAVEVAQLYQGYEQGPPLLELTTEQQTEHQLLRENKTYQDLLQQQRALVKERINKFSEVPTIMVMRELDQARETHVLVRGEYSRPGESVSMGAPVFLERTDASPLKNRLDLAHWLFEKENPLTARVTVNRYWQLIFGRGLVETSHDFGFQGSYPTHPELLDELARRFVESDWDVRWLVREIVLSATYRQSSKIQGDGALAATKLDPENKLLWRSPSHRLSAEMVRDAALAAADLLVRKVGGPSVKPYQPAGLWEEKSSFSQALLHYEQDHGNDLYRRSMYTFIRRTSPHPAMTTFDAPNRSECVVRREVTNTPLQALVLLNDPQFVEAARVLARRVLSEESLDTPAQIAALFRRLGARLPTDEEQTALLALYDQSKQHFATHAEAAESLLAVGEFDEGPSQAPDKADWAALTMVANTIMNSDVFYMLR